MKSTEERLVALESKIVQYQDRIDRVSDAERSILKRCREIAMAEVHGLLADTHGEFNTYANRNEIKRYVEIMVDNLRSGIRQLAAELGKP